jgi:hypothetical protein
MLATAAAVTMLTSAAAIAAAAVITAVATTAAVATIEQTGIRFFTADQGDADDCEKNRNAKRNKTIHPKSSKKSLTGTLSKTICAMPSRTTDAPIRRHAIGSDPSCLALAIASVLARFVNPVVKP